MSTLQKGIVWALWIFFVYSIVMSIYAGMFLLNGTSTNTEGTVGVSATESVTDPVLLVFLVVGILPALVGIMVFLFFVRSPIRSGKYDLTHANTCWFVLILLFVCWSLASASGGFSAAVVIIVESAVFVYVLGGWSILSLLLMNPAMIRPPQTDAQPNHDQGEET